MRDSLRFDSLLCRILQDRLAERMLRSLLQCKGSTQERIRAAGKRENIRDSRFSACDGACFIEHNGLCLACFFQ